MIIIFVLGHQILAEPIVLWTDEIGDVAEDADEADEVDDSLLLPMAAADTGPLSALNLEDGNKDWAGEADRKTLAVASNCCKLFGR